MTKGVGVLAEMGPSRLTELENLKILIEGERGILASTPSPFQEIRLEGRDDECNRDITPTTYPLYVQQRLVEPDIGMFCR